MTSRQRRALRGTAAAAVASVVAATAHTLAGGGAPAPLFVAAIAALTAPVAVALAGRAPSLWRTAAIVLASQGLFHAAFAIVGAADPVARVAHDHGAMLTALADPAPSAADASPLMLLGHVVAAIVTTLLVHGGEGMLRLVARGVRGVLFPALPAQPPVARPRRHAVAVVPCAPASRIFAADLSLRGPPALSY